MAKQDHIELLNEVRKTTQDIKDFQTFWQNVRAGSPDMAKMDEYMDNAVTIIGFDPESESIGNILIPCLEEFFTISDLLPETAYDVYISTVCNGSESPFSCQFTAVTACHNISYLEQFDDYDLCNSSCSEACMLSGAWLNLTEDDTDWIVF